MKNKNTKMSKECLVKVKYFQPEKQSSLESFALDGHFCYPSRYVYTNCWQRITDRGLVQCREVGGQAWWDFPDGVCENFLDYYRAEIVGEIDGDRYLERNRYELAQPINWEYVAKICNGG
jgi:hypothetical protein